jgi:protein involved in polysaccharide export with SLBB domain
VGSPTRNAGDEVVVIRAASGGGAPERLSIALHDIDTGVTHADVPLRDGDVVNVPVAKRYYISGSIAHPGAYRLQAGTTVAQAIDLAGGLTADANAHRVQIARLVHGKSQDIHARLDDVLMSDDAVKVPHRMF